MQDTAAVTDVTDMEHTIALQEQLHGGSDLCAAELYAAIKPSSVAEVDDAVGNSCREQASCR